MLPFRAAPKRKPAKVVDDDSDEDEKPVAKKAKGGESTWVVLKNLAWAADEAAIKSFFEDVGGIKQVLVGKFPGGGEREGLASVEFSRYFPPVDRLPCVLLSACRIICSDQA